MTIPLQAEMLAQLQIQQRIADGERYRLSHVFCRRVPSAWATRGRWLGALASRVMRHERQVLRDPSLQPPNPPTAISPVQAKS
jgi:hypothetical protein